MKRQKNVVETLEMLEEIWDEYQVYSGDELDPVSEKMEMTSYPDEQRKEK